MLLVCVDESASDQEDHEEDMDVEEHFENRPDSQEEHEDLAQSMIHWCKEILRECPIPGPMIDETKEAYKARMSKEWHDSTKPIITGRGRTWRLQMKKIDYYPRSHDAFVKERMNIYWTGNSSFRIHPKHGNIPSTAAQPPNGLHLVPTLYSHAYNMHTWIQTWLTDTNTNKPGLKQYLDRNNNNMKPLCRMLRKDGRPNVKLLVRFHKVVFLTDNEIQEWKSKFVFVIICSFNLYNFSVL
jgi:hypothetical protein